MKPSAKSTDPCSPETFAHPQLSVEAVIQIHDFVHYALDLFEVHYGTQIDGFYETLFEQSQDIELDLGDSSF